MIAPENLRVDPGADWMDPINSSPYVIYCIPMYLHDIKTKMNEVDPKTGMGIWKKFGNQLMEYANAMVKFTTSEKMDEFVEAEKHSINKMRRIFDVQGNQTVESIHKKLGKIIWDYCGMSRSEQGLLKALEDVKEIKNEFWRRSLQHS